jgi:hypothetical protein
MLNEYLAALWMHWVALMSGIVSLLIGIGLRVNRRVSLNKLADIPDWIFISIGIICLFWAGYNAWDDKNTALITLQEKLKAPEFVGEIQTVIIGNNNGLPLVAASGIITNPHGPPSGIINWHTFIEFPDGKRLQGHFPLFTGKDTTGKLLNSGGIKINLLITSYWPNICSQAISAGGSVNGWLMTDFEGLDFKKAIKENALFIIEFYDVVANKKHLLSYPMNRLPIAGLHHP